MDEERRAIQKSDGYGTKLHRGQRKESFRINLEKKIVWGIKKGLATERNSVYKKHVSRKGFPRRRGLRQKNN